jgi:hypothetical protein
MWADKAKVEIFFRLSVKSYYGTFKQSKTWANSMITCKQGIKLRCGSNAIYCYLDDDIFITSI